MAPGFRRGAIAAATAPKAPDGTQQDDAVGAAHGLAGLVGDVIGDAELAHARAHRRGGVIGDERRRPGDARARRAQDRRADQADADDARRSKIGGKGSLTVPFPP